MENYLEINRLAYEHLAEEYARRVQRYSESDKEILKPFIETVKGRFCNPLILETGPGSGLALKYFSDHSFETVAIDISRKIIEVAKRISSNTLYIEDNFLNHDFGNLTFDGIFSKAFVHLFPKTDAVKVLRKMRNLISERGIVFIGTTIHDFSEEGYTEKSDYDNTVRFRRKWTRDELFDAVLNEEFKIFSEQENFESGKHWYGLILEK